jgi:ubiquinone/menaquinone biosynthesis C-methylase UbiE
MNLRKPKYNLVYDALDQQVSFDGVMRPNNINEVNDIYSFLVDIHDQIRGSLRLDFRRLRYVNARGLTALSQFVQYARTRNILKLDIVASGILAWNQRVLPSLSKIWNQVTFQIYDQNFYRSQEIIEDQEFIQLLRNQTRIIWPLEKEVLAKHGLEKGMRVADICCGCGDIPLLICREFEPNFLIGVDHSSPAIGYARSSQEQFGINNASFQRGDATALMLDDNSFDFVLSRLSLQIFSQPELILSELVRITKPGGRIYILSEEYDMILGYPESDSIRETYRLAAQYGADMGMDLQQGKKLPNMLADARLDDIMVDHIIVDTNNADRDAFASVIESWREFSVNTIGTDLNLAPEQKNTLQVGYDAQLRTIRNPHGFTTWGMVACSGTKPVQ